MRTLLLGRDRLLLGRLAGRRCEKTRGIVALTLFACTGQFGLCLLSLFLTFVTQMVAFRLGTEALAKLGNSSPPHVHVMGHPGHVQEQDRIASSGRTNGSEDETAARADSLEKRSLADEDEEAFLDASEKNPVVAQVRKESQPLPSDFKEEEKAEFRNLFGAGTDHGRRDARVWCMLTLGHYRLDARCD